MAGDRRRCRRERLDHKALPKGNTCDQRDLDDHLSRWFGEPAG
ncbi:hypothetical protein ACH5A3_07500 [Streptomyces echinatus]